MNKNILVVTILAAALVGCRTANERAQKAQVAQTKPKIREIVINGVAGFQDTPMQPDGKWHVHDPARPQPPIRGGWDVADG